MRSPRLHLATAAVLALAVSASLAQAPPPSPVAPAPATEDRAVVEVDSVALFPVHGVMAYPARKRAREIAGRIVTLARDPTFKPESLTHGEAELGTRIAAGETTIMLVTEQDAALEGVDPARLAVVYVARIGRAIEEYRQAREPRVLLRRGGLVLGATALLVVLLLLLRWLERRLRAVFEQRYQPRIKGLQVQSLEIVRADWVRTSLRLVMQSAHALVAIAAILVYVDLALALLPWTRGVSRLVMDAALEPLRAMTLGFVRFLPSLAFLAVLAFLVRFGLRTLHLFFSGVEQGTIRLTSVDPELAWPTFRIVRVLIVVFALVMAYPHLPGSQSEAFKGISLFLGLVFSLGSSSVIGNLIAGYTLMYRRAFRVGDRIEVEDALGEVTEIRVLVTHLRSPRNEEIIIPNSVLLNCKLINYSSMGRKHGLIVTTTVGIGYDVPWRQVEAMLLLAARRTPEILAEPAPFVLQRKLGDFCVTYELCAGCPDARRMLFFKTELHRNVLDVFNEYGVAIMTPAYEGDPEDPKVVPPERWHAAPASPDASAPEPAPRG